MGDQNKWVNSFFQSNIEYKIVIKHTEWNTNVLFQLIVGVLKIFYFYQYIVYILEKKTFLKESTIIVK